MAIMPGAPLVNGVMRITKTMIGADMRCLSGGAGRCRRQINIVAGHEGRCRLDADFKIDVAVKINGNVTPSSGIAGCADEIHTPPHASGTTRES